MLRVFFVLMASASCMLTNAAARSADDFAQWRQQFRQYALSNHISPATFDKIFTGLQPDPKVLELDSNQPEFTRSIWQYMNNAISPARIKKGRHLLQTHHSLFNKIEAQYGVPREIIVAIWAMESDFGRNYGQQNVVRSLATLAYASQSAKRKAFARTELLLSLKILQASTKRNTKLIGSWAGAMGQPQFMPSSYLRYAVDYDNNGNKDIWHSLPDVFASIANFLAASGWQRDLAWGQEIRLPKPFNWRLNSKDTLLTSAEWQQHGIRRFDNRALVHTSQPSSLFIPAGKKGPVFLVSPNFYVIKRYNQSSSYALTVAQLSNHFGNGDTIQAPWPTADKALSTTQVKEIQQRLLSFGYSLGAIDGKIGSKTREAIKNWQLANGLAGDGYANVTLLARLRAAAKPKD